MSTFDEMLDRDKWLDAAIFGVEKLSVFDTTDKVPEYHENQELTRGTLDFRRAIDSLRENRVKELKVAIGNADIMRGFDEVMHQKSRGLSRLTDVCLYDYDEEAAERVKDDVLVSDIARGDVAGQNMLIGVELADMMAGGDVYETAERFIGALPREQQQAWRDKLDHCHTQSDGQALVGELFRNGVVEQYRANKARQEALEEERRMAFNGVFSELVKDANNEEAWNRFREGQARGAFTDADKMALQSAARAWGMMEMLMGDYSQSGAAVLLDNESGERIFNELYGDEAAQAVFLNVLNNEVQDLKNDASRRNALVRFGRAFAASTNNLMAGVIGGKFKAFVTDEQVDAYNREWERARELSGRENPNVAVYAEGDNWVEKYLLPGNARIDAIRKAAQESGQMNQDGSLRKMTAEERKGTQELGAFRGQLFNAVQGVYDVSGVAAKLGKMMPDSMIYLVPGGMFASAGSMHTQELARRSGKGEDYVSANTKAAVEAGISASVEKLVFGSLKPARMAPGLDWLMSRKVVGQALGKIYGSTAGRIGLGVVAGSAEETFAEPLAGLIMRGVYNVAAADELQLADPLGAYRKEMEEMLAPDQILVTGLYGLLLGGVSAGGHMQAAEDYREMYEHLVSIGVDEGRAAQAARDDAAVAGFKATKALFDEAVKKDTKGVIAYLAELYPQIEPLNVAENLFSTWQLPHLIPAENGQVKVQEKDEEGKVTETLMSKEAADLLVQARLEQMKSSEIAKFANQLLGVAMAGKASSETDRFIVEEVDSAMDADYFTRLANAAGVRLQQGARADEVDPEIHQHLTLGQLVQQGQAWEQRMEIQRNEVDRERAEKNLPPLTDEEWAERKKAYAAAVNRQSVRGADGRKRTLLRVSRGHYGAMNVLEDLTEDFIARDMAANNRGLEWYVQNIRELETALGRQNEFLRELGEGKNPVNQMDIIEAVGKIAQSKLLADTVKGEHGFSAALKSFLEMIRTLILKAAAMLKLGKAINQALTDETVRGKMDTEFLQLVDDVVAQDIEFLRELQLEDGLKAMQRVIAARQEANADTRVKRRRKAKTPVLDKAEKNHGKQVREAARKKRRKQAKVDADVEVAEAALEGDSGSMSVTDAQERGLFEDGVLEASNAVVTEPSFSIEALHATPHRFRKFDTSKMGSGEGYQAFGWGLYFSGDEGSNRHYYGRFSTYRHTYVVDGKVLDGHDGYKKLYDELSDILLAYGSDELYMNEMNHILGLMHDGYTAAEIKRGSKLRMLKKRKGYKDAYYTALEEMEERGLKVERVDMPAANYRVELNVEESDLMPWDSPVSDALQAEIDAMQRQVAEEDWQKTFAEMKALGIKGDDSKRENLSGYQVYNELVRRMDSPKAASAWLAAHGVKGIKYFDGFSRYEDNESKTYNYVIFSGDDVKITGVNETGDYNAPWEEYEDTDASFSVVGENAANWDEIKHLSFRGRDDGKLRVELDASQAKVSDAAFESRAYHAFEDLVAAGFDETLAEEDAKALADYAAALREFKALELELLTGGVDSASEAGKKLFEKTQAASAKRKALQAAAYDVLERWSLKRGGLSSSLINMPQGAKDRLVEDFMNGRVSDESWEALNKIGQKLFVYLGDALDFPDLYEAYPELKSLEVWTDDLGVYTRGRLVRDEFGKFSITLNEELLKDVLQMRSTLLHEVQHWIQFKENFAKGGNETMAERLVSTGLEERQRQIQQVKDELDWLNGIDFAKEQLQRIRRILQRPRAILKMSERWAVHEVQNVDVMAAEAVDMMWDEYALMQRMDAALARRFASGPGKMLPVRNAEKVSLYAVENLLAEIDKMKSRKVANKGRKGELLRRMDDIYGTYQQFVKLDGLNGYALYQRLAGEIEARNVQLRRDWTAAERAARPFNETLEYPGEALVSFSVFSPSESSGLRALQSAVRGKQDAVFRSDTLNADVMLPFGSAGVYKNPDNPKSKIVGAHGLLHIITARMAHGDSLEEATYTAVKAVLAAVNGRIVDDSSSENKKELTLDGYNTWVYLKWKAENKAWVVTGYKENDKHSSVDDRQRAMNLAESYALNTFGGLERVGAALEYSIARVAREYKQNNANPFLKLDFSSSMINLDEESVAREVVDAGQGFRANLAYSEAIMREMRGAMQRLRKLGSKTRTDREDAVAAMGTMVQMVKAAVAVLPKGYRFSVHPYLNRIEALAELAATGDIDLTSDIASKDILQLENAEGVDLKKPYDEMVKEYGNVKLAEALERIMHRVSEQLRKHAKDRAVEKITELVERLAPKKDPKTGKLKGGKMSADAYRDLATVAEAMGMNSEQLEAKLAALRADMAKPGISEELREQLEDEMTLYDQFGDLASMTAEDAVAAYEALRVRIYFHRFEWDDKQARIRGARRAVVRRVVDGVGSVSENEYNAKKRRVKPGKRLKNLGDILSGMPAALAGMRGYLPLRQMADELALRTNAAGEAIKAWEAERWLALEALSKETIGKSWRECMDFMHKVQPSGVSFDRPKFRTVNVKTEELRELLAMTREERKAEMKRRREAGGLEAERALSERDVQELQKKLEAMEEEGRVLSRVETRYMVEVQHEENLQLSRGEALYAILMFEQPTYTERLIMQGYTFEVIEGLREYVGDGMLQFGYGLRELFAKQGDRIAAVYENAFGVPFPREENYFAARWVVNGMKENSAEQLLAGMAGTAGAGNGWMKQRVNHNLELDMTKDALQVFLQATSLTDTWMATQDIVADFKAWTRDADFERALTAVLGKESYDNLKDWIRILEQGGVQDCLNMGVSQDVINGLYGSGAVAILGLRIQTLLKQTPAIFNGLLGAHDISAAEWFATMSRMKNGDAPMTYKRMVNSTLMKMRQQGKAGNMAGQAMRSGDTASSAAEGLLMASMLPMEWMDARCTAIGLVPVWNVYYQRAVDQGASAQEAEQAAWEQTALVANLASQPIGLLNKSKIAQSRNPIVKSAFYMLSENTAKFALCRALWRGGKKKAAIRAWLVYGAANAAISAMLDALQGDPEEFEKGKWWEYVLSALYGPASGIPGVGEALEAAVNALLNLTGEVTDIDWMKKMKTRASAGRALIDIQGSWKAMKRIYGFMTDNKEHSLAEYTRAAGTVSRTLAIGTGWMGNMVGYWSTAVAVLMNPIDFGARVWRNIRHYWD